MFGEIEILQDINLMKNLFGGLVLFLNDSEIRKKTNKKLHHLSIIVFDID